MIPVGIESESRDKVIIDKKESIEAYRAFTWSDYYAEKFNTHVEDGKGYLGFNFWAFLFGYRWFLFRKMTKLGLTLFIIENLIIASALMTVKELRLEPLVAFSCVVSALLFLMLLMGIFGNYAYFKFSQSKITKVSNSLVSEESFGEVIRSLGGVSLLSVFVVMGVSLLLQMLVGGI
ncbi:DUF2628 domain-containing protein [Vibrio hippocampi]|uniref:DUF2628 domain-containing protein n=1 Tax=Vibrio hippocampi TaxID=654686 RepID=A0ABM8ZGA3_9VIBR|nr:DUF2628 domain-containing protein [Vibrio hippocampi]CAH0525675.1 hypothetical protein VHP8226_01205 [Vibrio hippocampi]